MRIPKNNIKYRSIKRIKSRDKYIKFFQMACYNGHLPMICDNCHISKNCWFCGLKPFKG